MDNEYKFYTVGIMKDDKVVKEFTTIMAKTKQEAIDNVWYHIDAQPFRDGQHYARAYA